MWSTCKVVHHVHAVGALVHQAAQARPLQARSCGGLGEGALARQVATRAQRGAAWRASALLSQYQQLIRTFFFLQKQKNVVQFYEKIANMAQYMTEKEILTLVSAGAVKAAQATVSVTRPGSWHLSFDLANGVNVLVGTARGI